MTRRLLLEVVFLSIACFSVARSGVALPGCLPVTGSRILGRDLAGADPHFSALPATLAVGFIPAPGTKRVYATLELQRLARANGIPVTAFGDICFELPMLRLTGEDATTAMRKSLPTEASLKIVELAKLDVPAGPLEFPIEGLEPPAPLSHGVQLWRGHVTYAETRHASVWARVEVTVQYQAVVAVQDLPVDNPIGAGSLRLETRTGPLEREKPATRIEDVLGRIPRRALKAGSPIPLALLADAPAVRKGDPVTVEVQSGPAHLRFEAIAQNPARDGDVLELRNPFNGKTFKARLDPGPKALIVISSGQL
jgi:flagella basal body P-ring formation protein FlgA